MAATGIYLTAQQNLQTALAANALAMSKLYSDPRPDYSIDGRSFSWTAMRKSLLEEQELLLKRIQDLDGPFEQVVIGA